MVGGKVRCHGMGVEIESSAPEVGGDPLDQFARVHNRSLTPSRGKVALVAGDQIVCAGGLCTFKKLIVGWVVGDHQCAGWSHDLCRLSNQPHRSCEAIPSEGKLRTGKNSGILGENRFGSGQLQFSSKHKVQGVTLEAFVFQVCRYHHIGIQHNPNRF